MKTACFKKIMALLLVILLFTGSASAMKISHNVPALTAHRNLTNNNSQLTQNLEKLSSGHRINRAGDDAAGLAISEQMRAQITGLSVAQPGEADGKAMIASADEAAGAMYLMLGNMEELAKETDRENWNQAPGDMDASDPQAAQPGEQKAANQPMIFLLDESTMGVLLAYGESSVMALTAESTGEGYIFSQFATSGGTIFGSDNPRALLVSVRGDIAAVGEGEANIAQFDGAGAFLSGGDFYTDGTEMYMHPGREQKIAVEGTVVSSLILALGETRQLGIVEREITADSPSLFHKEFITRPGQGDQTKIYVPLNAEGSGDSAGEGSIRDTDLAEERMAYTKKNILVQAAQAMLSQANAVPQGGLGLNPAPEQREEDGDDALPQQHSSGTSAGAQQPALDAASDEKRPVWASENERIATVDQDGNVTAVSPGETAITATIHGVTESVLVTVSGVCDLCGEEGVIHQVMDCGSHCEAHKPYQSHALAPCGFEGGVYDGVAWEGHYDCDGMTHHSDPISAYCNLPKGRQHTACWPEIGHYCDPANGGCGDSYNCWVSNAHTPCRMCGQLWCNYESGGHETACNNAYHRPCQINQRGVYRKADHEICPYECGGYLCDGRAHGRDQGQCGYEENGCPFCGEEGEQHASALCGKHCVKQDGAHEVCDESISGCGGWLCVGSHSPLTCEHCEQAYGTHQECPHCGNWMCYAQDIVHGDGLCNLL